MRDKSWEGQSDNENRQEKSPRVNTNPKVGFLPVIAYSSLTPQSAQFGAPDGVF